MKIYRQRQKKLLEHKSLNTRQMGRFSSLLISKWRKDSDSQATSNDEEELNFIFHRLPRMSLDVGERAR